MRYFKDMKGIVGELLLHNSYLASRLEQSSGEDKNKDTAILNAVNRLLQASKRFEMAVMKKTQTDERQPSYAEKVKMTSNRVGPKAVKPPRNVVIIRPETENGDIKTSDEACDALFTLVYPRKKGLQVTAIRKLAATG